MQNNDDLRKQAKQLFDDKKFDEACQIYKTIYNINCDKWIGWEYASALKKSNNLDDAIAISKEVYCHNKNFNYNCNLLSWLVYEKYFKILKEKYDYAEINNLLKIAYSVTEFTEHNPKNALEKVIFKMIKILKSSANVRYNDILKLIEKLDVDMLSTHPGKFERNGREKEYQSPKESYYSIKTKALLETGDFEQCIKCCEDFEKNINQSHHYNISWVLSRKANSLAKLGKIDKAIQLLNDVVLKKQHWSLFETLANIHLLNNDNKSALLCFYRAALTSDPPKMKVGLYVEIAKLLIKENKIEIAILHLIFAKQIRDDEEWKITQELSELMQNYTSEDLQKNVSLNELKKIWCNYIYEILGKYKGRITRINKGGKNGFIQTDNGSHFFKTLSFVSKTTPQVGMNVICTLIDSYDSKKNSKTLECAYIKFDN